jgi:hypothetical protein
MQTIYQLNTKEIDNNFFEAFKQLFENKNIKITVEEVKEIRTCNSFETFKKSKPIKIDPSIDIRALIEESRDPKIEL